MFLSPYSWDLAPIEKLFAFLKRNRMQSPQTEKESPMREFGSILALLSGVDTELVKSFWRAMLQKLPFVFALCDV